MRLESVKTLTPNGGSERPAWKLGWGVSVAVHLFIGGALLINRQPTSARPVSLSAPMAVQIMPAPAAPAAPSHESPPDPPQPRPTPVTPHDNVNLPDAPLNTPIENAEAVLQQRKAREEAPDRPPSPPAPPPAAMSVPAKSAAAPVKGTPTRAFADAEQSYNALILAKLESRKRYPNEARRQKIEDVVYIRIGIARDGRIIDSAIVRSRNFTILDDAVRDLVRRADPLPKLPESIVGERYVVTVPIDFFMRVR